MPDNVAGLDPIPSVGNGDLSDNKVDTTITPTTDGDWVNVSICSLVLIFTCCSSGGAEGDSEKKAPPK